MKVKLDDCFDGFGRVDGKLLKEYLMERLEPEMVAEIEAKKQKVKKNEEVVDQMGAELKKLHDKTAAKEKKKNKKAAKLEIQVDEDSDKKD